MTSRNQIQFVERQVKGDVLSAISSYKTKFNPLITKDPCSILLRPSFGTKGIPTAVGVNYFELNGLKDLELYYYTVDLVEKKASDDPVTRRINIKSIIENELLKIEPFKSKIKQIYYRSKNDLYSRTVLPIDEDEVYTFGSGDKSVKVKVKAVKTLKFKDLFTYLQLKTYTKDFQEVQEYSNALLAVIGSQALQNKKIIGLGSNKFFLFDKGTELKNFQTGLNFCLGTFASVRCFFDSVKLNLNVTPAIFYKSFTPNGQPMNVLDLIQDFLEIRTIPNSKDIKRAEQFIKGVKIYRKYLSTRSPRSITGIDLKKSSTNFKFDNEGKSVSVEEYFKSKWNIVLRHPALPLIEIGKDVFLPMEISFIVPYQQFRGEITDMRNLIKYTAIRPMEKAKIIAAEKQKVFNRLDFGAIDSKFIKVPSRVLSAPSIKYKNRIVKFPEVAWDGKSEKRKGDWNLEQQQFVSPPKSSKPYKFCVFVIKDGFLDKRLKSSQTELQNACLTFFNELKRLGLNVAKDMRKESLNLESPLINQDDLESKLNIIFSRAKKDKCDYVLCIMPKKDTTVYRAIKRVGDLKVGIINSCVIYNVFTKKRGDKFNTQTYAQMAMKINLKLGGSNHSLSQNDSKLLFDTNMKPVFILGADVTHPTGQQNKESVSVASVVGSEDGIFNKFPGSIRVQKGGQEMIQGIKSMVLERLENYFKKIGALPTKVLFYRDGVSEGQYYTVLKEELTKIKAAFREFAESKSLSHSKPKITFMIVVKRHHTRFIPLEKDANYVQLKKKVAVMSNDNVSPGTVVDKNIVSAAFFDFYIQSQQALQGTGIPAHYYVLHDENNYSPDDIQTLTYNLCHTFGRATKSTKIVPAAYYADLLCTRGKDYIAGFEKKVLSTTKTPIQMAIDRIGSGVESTIKSTMFYI